MTNADWWARVVQARTERDDLLPQRLWALRKGEHEAAIDLKAVPGIGAEIVLTVDGAWRKTRLFRSHEQADWSARSPTRRRHLRRRGGPNGARRSAVGRSEHGHYAGHGCNERQKRTDEHACVRATQYLP